MFHSRIRWKILGMLFGGFFVVGGLVWVVQDKKSMPLPAREFLSAVAQSTGSAVGELLPLAKSETREHIDLGNQVSAVATSSLTLSAEFSSARAAGWCTLNSWQEPNHEIIFNEVAWMGGRVKVGQTTSASANKEWIELRNNSGRDVSLEGWQLTSESDNVRIRFEKGMVVHASKLFLLERGDDALPQILADLVYTGALSNTGENLFLFNPDCVISDIIDSSKGWVAGNSETRQTMERNVESFGWHTSVSSGGTPREQNSRVGDVQTGIPPVIIPPSSSHEPVDTPPVSSPHIIISEVQVTGGTGHSGDDFVRLYNTGDSEISLAGFKLRKRSQSGSETSVKVFSAEHSIAPRAEFTWASTSGGFSDEIHADASSGQTLAADNSIALLSPDEVVISALAWGFGHTSPFVEGTSFPTNPGGGETLQRVVEDGVMKETGNNAGDFFVNG